MSPNNDGQGAMDLIVQLEEKVRKYKKERDEWRYRVYQVMASLTIGSVRFNLGVIVGGGIVGVIWFIVHQSLKGY